MFNRSKNTLLLVTLTLAISMSLFIGCGDREAKNPSSEEFLKKDALAALKSTYAEDYTRITIIRGALNKFIVNTQKPQFLGIATGAMESAVFPEDYELKRLSQLENITAEMRKEIIRQPMLMITVKKREVFNHIYQSVFKPLSEQTDKGQQAGPQETAVLTELINLLDDLTQNYSVLADQNVDFHSSEAQQAFYSVQQTFREMQKLQLFKQANPKKS